MDVEADTLDVYDGEKRAVFHGNVKSKQGDFLVRTVEMVAFYSGQTGLLATTGEEANRAPSQLTRVECKQKVLIISKEGQSATGDWAIFDTKANTVLLGDDVTVSRGKDVAQGPRLKIDLNTGMYRFELEQEPAVAQAAPAVISSPPLTAPAANPAERPCAPGRQCLLVYPKDAMVSPGVTIDNIGPPRTTVERAEKEGREGLARLTELLLPGSGAAVLSHLLDTKINNAHLQRSDGALEFSYDQVVRGVSVTVVWRYVENAVEQPPLKVVATLGSDERKQLGLDISDVVDGPVAVEILIPRGTRDGDRIHFRADLLNADVKLESIAWRKPKGRVSVLEFDVVHGSSYPTELNNVRMVGDNVAIEGWMGVGADNKLKEFRFPNFSLNVVSSLETHGKVRSDGIWEVSAKGPTYDGRDLFRAFFDVAQLGDPSSKASPGLDLRAEVDTVVGYSDTTLRNVKVSLQKRANKLTSLDMRGVLEGGKPFAAEVRQVPDQPRRLRAEAMDAGQLFKFAGLYSNAVGGAMNLEVNLDGQGAAERTGTLWVRDFVVLGDPIISEVLQNADSAPSGTRSTVRREQFDFEMMRVPFSVGHGQLVMHNSVINGQLVSASMRGTIDFRAQTLDFGGTVVPMSGLMRTPAQGITFAIQGPTRDPKVVVNPLAPIPGVFRENLQMTPDDPRVAPPDRGKADGDKK
jgi:lipopolysaccharide export system protein LptA